MSASEINVETGTTDLLFNISNGVATITFNRPDAKNALSPAMSQGLQDALARFPSQRRPGFFPAAFPRVKLIRTPTRTGAALASSGSSTLWVKSAATGRILRRGKSSRRAAASCSSISPEISTGT